MKLTINRKESKTGLIFKKPIWVLETQWDVTPEEKALIKKYKWAQKTIGEGRFIKDQRMDPTISMIMGKWSPAFDSIEDLLHMEELVINAVKIVKSNIESLQDFQSDAPRKIEI